MYVISGSTHQRLGASLAEEMDAEFCGVVNRHFPDGERYIRVLMDVTNQDVVVVQNTFPDKKIVELLLILQAVKEAKDWVKKRQEASKSLEEDFAKGDFRGK